MAKRAVDHGVDGRTISSTEKAVFAAGNDSFAGSQPQCKQCRNLRPEHPPAEQNIAVAVARFMEPAEVTMADTPAVPSIAMADNRNIDDKWPADVVNELRKLISEKRLTARELAAAITRYAGEVYTRNSIIGKVRRLGLVLLRGNKPLKPPIRKKKPKVILDRPLSIAVKPATAPTPPSLAEVVANPKRLTILEIHRGQCYWPTNLEGVTLFCGHDTGSSEHSWCPPHKKLAYQPPSQRSYLYRQWK